MKRFVQFAAAGAVVGSVVSMVPVTATAQQSASTSSGQAYPTRAIWLVVPFPAGGTADVLGRMMAQRLSAPYGQQIVVENRAGSGGHVGAEPVARAVPDGYTIMFGTIGIHGD